MNMDKDKIWKEILKKYDYKSFLNTARLISVNQEHATIEVSNAFFKEHIEKHCPRIKEDIRDITNNYNLKVIFQLKGVEHEEKEYLGEQHYKYIENWLKQDSTTIDKTKAELVLLLSDKDFNSKIEKIRGDFGYPINGFETETEYNNFSAEKKITFGNIDNKDMARGVDMTSRIMFLLNDLMLDNNYHLFMLCFTRYGFNMFKFAVPIIRDISSTIIKTFFSLSLNLTLNKNVTKKNLTGFISQNWDTIKKLLNSTQSKQSSKFVYRNHLILQFHKKGYSLKKINLLMHNRGYGLFPGNIRQIISRYKQGSKNTKADESIENNVTIINGYKVDRNYKNDMNNMKISDIYLELPTELLKKYKSKKKN